MPHESPNHWRSAGTGCVQLPFILSIDGQKKIKGLAQHFVNIKYLEGQGRQSSLVSPLVSVTLDLLKFSTGTKVPDP